MFAPEELKREIERIRRENGFEVVPFVIEDVIYDESEGRLFIIGQDRADKSAIIGNSFVIGKLKEKLGVKQITVYSNLDLLLRKRELEKNMNLIEGTFLEFLIPLLKAELNYPPMRWPEIKNNGKALVFLSVYADALVGFARAFGLEPLKVGIRHSFPHLEYEPIEGTPREIFFPDEEKLLGIAEERDLRIIIADFSFGVKFAGDMALINPMRLLQIPHFRIKHIFGFRFPAYTHLDKRAALDFFLKLADDNLLEPTDGANLIWKAWKKGKGKVGI
ncbi:hypothetical protein [Palaeococcus sp. (in: euryarchaeotes)]